MSLHLHEIALRDFSVRAALLTGSRHTLLWDSLSHPRDMANFVALCGDNPPLIVYSHADWDHVLGTAAFGRAPVVIAHQHAAHRFLEELPRTLAEFRADAPESWSDVVLIPPTIVFQRTLVLDLGELFVQLEHLPGHTEDSIVAHIPKSKTLLVGDSVEYPCPCVPANRDLRAWISHLERWMDDPAVHTVIPSHGPMGGKTLLEQTATYLCGLLQKNPRPIPETSSPFYLQTHAANLAHYGLVPADTDPSCPPQTMQSGY